MSVRNYNHDMLAGINQLKQLRDSVASQIEAEQAVSNKLKDEIAVLSERMMRSQSNLKVLNESMASYTKTLEETELVYNKIEESSQNLLNVIKRETKSIQKTLNAKNVP
ncbi:hypothetical protein ACHAWU_008194 [Discostella pseudostelligera]|uniref:Uncharacterized protein n=1 Tax=Discostella pseudostelligera TaxID=259834 RepID=A0ABD3MI53_9STRA